MPSYLIVTIIAGVFFVVGIILRVWSNREMASYGQELSKRPDLREFAFGWPERPEPMALRIGSWVSFALTLASLVLALVWWLYQA